MTLKATLLAAEALVTVFLKEIANARAVLPERPSQPGRR